MGEDDAVTSDSCCIDGKYYCFENKAYGCANGKLESWQDCDDKCYGIADGATIACSGSGCTNGNYQCQGAAIQYCQLNQWVAYEGTDKHIMRYEENSDGSIFVASCGVNLVSGAEGMSGYISSNDKDTFYDCLNSGVSGQSNSLTMYNVEVLKNGSSVSLGNEKICADAIYDKSDPDNAQTKILFMLSSSCTYSECAAQIICSNHLTCNGQ